MNEIEMVNPASFGPWVVPYSQATVAGGFIFVAGQVAIGCDYVVVAPGNAYWQTHVALDRVSRILAETGGSLTDVVTATVFLANRDRLAEFDEAWAERFGQHRPAVATVFAGLPIDDLVVEVQCVALHRDSRR